MGKRERGADEVRSAKKGSERKDDGLPSQAEPPTPASQGTRLRGSVKVTSKENSIRPSRARLRRPDRASGEQSAARSDEGARRPTQLGLVADTESNSPRSRQKKQDSDPWTVPIAVRERFAQEGHRFYFPDGTLAFRDRGRKLTTESENTQVIASLVEIAVARDWKRITVAGTDRFRQEAWRQARIAGLEVRGYRPSDAERAQLARSLGTRESPRKRTDRESAAPDSQTTSPSSGDERGRRGEGPARSAGHELIVGRLLDHGRDTYRFDPHEEISYFVRLETSDGKRVIWGKDLERAIGQALTQPKFGDEVGVRRIGHEAVTVKRRERDEDGHVVREKDLNTHRNRWVVEKLSFFESRAAAAGVVRNENIEPRDAVRKHPELAGTYVHLRAAQIAASTIADPADQERFVRLVRGAIADAVERGDPLQPVRLRTQTDPKRERRVPEQARQERSAAPTQQ